MGARKRLSRTFYYDLPAIMANSDGKRIHFIG